MVRPIQEHDFVKVVNPELKKEGLNVGDVLFVAGVVALPVDEDDPYLQRVYISVIDQDEGIIINEGKVRVADPRSFEFVGDEEQERLIEIHNEYYLALHAKMAGKATADASVN